jgi:hypothetical protein
MYNSRLEQIRRHGILPQALSLLQVDLVAPHPVLVVAGKAVHD